VLAAALPYAPAGVHLAVVDPGVGSPRKAVAVRVAEEERLLVGPDNGLLSAAIERFGGAAEAVDVSLSPVRLEPISATFHGRDVFAPAAARIAMGAPIDALGPTAESPVIRRTPEARRLGNGAIQGEVISIDRYGNAITNIVAFPATQTRNGEQAFIEVGGRTIPVARAYSDVQPLGLVAVCGSSGLLEIAVREGSAAQTLSLTRGAAVTLHNAARS
jgi:S-adenosyl-L-methionine hydrolase (adenosine-forming)